MKGERGRKKWETKLGDCGKNKDDRKIGEAGKERDGLGNLSEVGWQILELLWDKTLPRWSPKWSRDQDFGAMHPYAPLCAGRCQHGLQNGLVIRISTPIYPYMINFLRDMSKMGPFWSGDRFGPGCTPKRSRNGTLQGYIPRRSRL